MEANPQKAKSHFREATAGYRTLCNGGNGYTCSQLGVIYERGFGLDGPDLKKARRYQKKGCKNDYQPACDAAQRLKKSGSN